MSDKPLDGKVFCCTAVEADLRSETIRCIEAMGGVHKQNLMSDVKYMIVGSRDTPKYEYAAKRRIDMTLLRTSFIPDLFQRWQSGEELQAINDELESGKLGVFEGLRVCCTNISHERTALIQMIEEHGGIYSPDLTRKVTHLVSQGSEGRKFEFATKWEIFTVHPQWIYHSVRRGAALRENFFNPDSTAEQVGAGACDMWPEDLHKLEQEEKEQVIAVPRRVKKRKIEFSQVWESVLDNNAKPIANTEEPIKEAWDEREMVAAAKQGPKIEKKQELMFIGQVFEFKGFDESKLPVLEKVIKSNGGSLKGETTICIVNSEVAPLDRPELPDAVCATEWMIERSMHKKQMMVDQWGLLHSYYNIPGFESLNIHFTGYSGVEALHIPKLIRNLGGQHQETLEATPGQPTSTDVMVVNSDHPKITIKIKLCKRDGVPMVNEKWLFECADRGIIAPITSDFAMFERVETDKLLRRRSVQGVDSSGYVPSDGSIQDLSSKLKRPKSERRKLVGRAVTSNLTSQEGHRESTPADAAAADDDNNHNDENQPAFTQVSYNDPETAKDHKKLMEALGTKESSLAKSQRSEIKVTPAENANGKRQLRKRS